MANLLKKIFALLVFLANFCVIHPSYSLDTWVKVHVLSRYSIDQTEIISPLAQLREVSKKSIGEASLLPADSSLRLRASNKKVQVTFGSSQTEVDQILIEPPRGSLVTVKTAEGLQRKFMGRLSVRSVKGSLFFVEELLLEDYVRGVLESEMPRGFPDEALKAQAVLIRTYALAHFHEHKKEDFNFCDTTHCQVYGGRNLPFRSLDEAVNATRSTILVYEFKPVEALYHSTCGGHTSDYQKVFRIPESLPYLKGVNDEKYCDLSPHTKWQSSIPLKILEEVLKKDPATDPKGEIVDLKVVEREMHDESPSPQPSPVQGEGGKEGDKKVSPSPLVGEGWGEGGRSFTLALKGRRSLIIPAIDFVSVIQRYLGWSQIKSNWFDVEVKEGEAHFKGRGLGHGVGFCQWGAKGMAEAGKKFDEILFHYFPGTQLVERPK
jgi:stage II sporulation protein D